MATAHKIPRPRAVFVDTSAWYAYLNRADPDHTAVANFLEGFSGQLVTSNYVFDELITLVRMRMGHKQDRSDKTYSFTDCTSFVVMRRLKLTSVLATDKHFRQEGFSVYPR